MDPILYFIAGASMLPCAAVLVFLNIRHDKKNPQEKANELEILDEILQRKN